uniref:G-protein coupled receptors family 1 profile domain-containing protein n=1 Tax=Pelusios castaneus TaxID=367368 RepID=A0A8C8SDY9_9SAUR
MLGGEIIGVLAAVCVCTAHPRCVPDDRHSPYICSQEADSSLAQSFLFLSKKVCIPKSRTLQLTLVLIALFALCRLPRFVLELSLAFVEAPAAAGLREARTALGIVAVTNSALNPYAYLLFQSHRPWARRLQRSLCRAGPGPTCCCPGPEGEPQPRRRPNHRAPDGVRTKRAGV